MDSVLEVLGAFASSPELVNQGLIGLNHFASGPVFHWLNEDGVAVDLGQDHDVLVPTLSFLWEAPRLVGEDLLGGLAFHFKDAYEDGALFLCQAWQGASVAVTRIVTAIQCGCSLLGRL